MSIVNILTISRTVWKIAARVNKWTIVISINEQILQHMMDSIWINIAIIFLNAAMDKNVLQEVGTSLVFSILSPIA